MVDLAMQHIMASESEISMLENIWISTKINPFTSKSKIAKLERFAKLSNYQHFFVPLLAKEGVYFYL
jgi:hypothetical protein